MIFSFDHLLRELVGERGLAELLEDRAVRLGLQRVLDELLLDRRGALDGASVDDVVDERARDPADVDAALGLEALVLDRDHRLLDDLGDLRGRDDHPVLLAEHADRVAEVVEQFRALLVLELREFRQRRQVGGDGHEHAEDERDQAEQQHGEEDQQEAQPLQTWPAAGRQCGGLHRGRESTIGPRWETHQGRRPTKPPSSNWARSTACPRVRSRRSSGRRGRRAGRCASSSASTRPRPTSTSATRSCCGKLREFQDAGHRVVLIVGDYTARVGDPSGRSSLRPMLSGGEIEANAATFQEQASRILDPDPERLEVRRNGEWLDMALTELLALVRTTTVAQLLERDDFAKRLLAKRADLDARAALPAAAGL